MQYWDCVNKRMSREYTGIHFFVHTSLIKSHLETQWNLRKWKGDQLTWICDALNAKYEPLNPSYFINDRIAYMNHLQDCYYLEKKWMNILYIEPIKKVITFMRLVFVKL